VFVGIGLCDVEGSGELLPARKTRELFVASDISSVIAPAESENRSKQTAADETMWKRLIR
jgi:hypothetical protein